MGLTRRNMEGTYTENNEDYDTLAQEILEDKNISKWPRDHSCNILTMNVAAFCPCPKHLPEAKLRKFELMSLAEKISRQSSNCCVA